MTFPRKFTTLEYGSVLDYGKERLLTEKFVSDLERIKKERDKVIIILGWSKTPRLTIHYYVSDTYPDLQNGMYYIYLANRNKKIVVGGFETLSTLRAYIEEYRKEYWWTNRYALAEVLAW